MKEGKKGNVWEGTARMLCIALLVCLGTLIRPALSADAAAADGAVKFSSEYAKPGEILTVTPEEELPGGCNLSYTWSVGDKQIQNSTDSYPVTENDLEKMIAVQIKVTGAVQKTFSGSMYCSELPVMYVTTEAEITGKVEYVKGTLRTQMCDEYQDAKGYEGDIEIRWRGNSTIGLPKKPYKLKLDKKTNMFGFGKNKHWVLLANYLDHAFMRNSLSYNLSGEMDMPYMQSVNVVLIKDGKYQGLYQFGEQIRVDQDSDGNRVDIYDWESAAEDSADVIAKAEGFSKDDTAALEDAMLSDLTWATTGTVTYKGSTYRLSDYEIVVPDRTGGFLIELDEYFDEISKFRSWQLQQPLNLKNPETVYSSSEMMEYVVKYINSFETAIQNKNFTAEYEGDQKSYSELFDMDSLVDFWLVNELFMNEDAMKKSTYMYKDIDGLFHMGPIWDMDWAAAGEGDTKNPEVWQTLYYSANAQNNQWYKYIIKDPYFAVKAYNRFHEIRNTLLEDIVKQGGYIDQNQERMFYAAEADFALWGNSRDYSYQVSILRSFLTRRLTWLDQQFSSVESLMYSWKANSLVQNDIKVDTSNKDTNRAEFAMPSGAVNAEVRVNGIYLGAAKTEGGMGTITFDNTCLSIDGSQNIVTVNYQTNKGGTSYSYGYFSKSLQESYRVSVSAGAGGSAGIVTNGGLVNELEAAKDTQVTVRAQASEGYTFVGWYESSSKISAQAEYSFIPTAEHTLEARFKKNEEPPKPVTYKVKIAVDPGGTAGIVSGNTLVSELEAEEGTVVTVRAAEGEKYTFDGWYENGTKAAGTLEYRFAAMRDYNLQARFIKNNKQEPPVPDKKSVDSLKISSIKDRAYTGKAARPSLSVKDGAGVLKLGRDYTVTYKNNKKTGKASVTLSGIGNYTGSRTLYFRIVPKKPGIPKSVSSQKRSVKVAWKRDKQASGYQIQYSLKKSFKNGSRTILIKKNSITSKKIEKLKSRKKYYVRIRAYKTIGKGKAYGAYSKVKTVKVI